VKSICQAVVDRCNKPRTFSHQEILDLPSIAKVECATDAYSQAIVDFNNDESVQEAVGKLGCPPDLKSIFQAVVDLYNKPRTFSHQEIFGLPLVTKVECATDVQNWTRSELTAVPLLINERPETMFVSDTQLLTLDLSPGNYGLKSGDELSKLNLLSLFQAVEVRLSVGQLVRMAS
jgi:hypothetical protein